MAFNITIPRRVLLSELAFAASAAERRSTLPALSYVLLTAIKTDDHSALRITSTDLDQCTMGLCHANVQESGSILVHARRFYDFLRYVHDGDLQIASEANDWVTVRIGRSRTRMPSMSPDSFPKVPSFPKDMGEMPTPVIRRLTAAVAFAISNEAQRYVVNGAKLIASESAITMVATDGHRLSLAADSSPYKGAAIQPVIPRKSIHALRQMMDAGEEQTLSFGMDDSHLFFRYGSRGLVARKLTGAFPDFAKIMPKSNGKPIRLSRKDLMYSLVRVSQFATGQTKTINVGVSKGKFVISTTSDDGASEEQISLEGSHEDITTRFNAAYLIEYLNAIPSSAEVNIELNPGTTPSLMYPHPVTEGSLDQYLVMPCRTSP